MTSYKWSAERAAKDKQLFPSSHWFAWSACVISEGLQYIIALCIRFLGMIKKTAGILEEQKKQQPTNKKPNKKQRLLHFLEENIQK